MLFLPPFYFVFSARGVLPPFPISVGRDDPGAPLSEFAQGGAACSSQAFPLGGRWHGEAVTDEGAMTERFRFLQGDFAACGRRVTFWTGQKVTKEPLGLV